MGEPMTIEELRAKAREIINTVGEHGVLFHADIAHGMLDDLMEDYINDEEFSMILREQARWYS